MVTNRIALFLLAGTLAGCGGDTAPVAGGGGGSSGQPVICNSAGGDGTFERVTGAVGLCKGPVSEVEEENIHFMGGGLAMSDYNKDGQLDLYVAYGRGSRGQLYTFDGSQFMEVAGNAGIQPTDLDQAGYFVDVDNDGWEDFVSIQYRNTYVEIFRNNGDGTFSEATAATGIQTGKRTYSMAASDIDLDGDLDLFFAHWGELWRGAPAMEYLWENDGSGNFTDISDTVEIKPSWRPPNNDFLAEHSFTPIFADINGDSYPDLLLASDFSGSQVLINDSGNGFIDATTDVISDENGMGSAVADYDRDGDFDWFVSSIFNLAGDEKNYVGGESGNRLYRNDGGVFADVTDEAGVRFGAWGWGSCFADFDNDGHPDIFHTAGMEQIGSDYDDPDDPLAPFLQDVAQLYMSDGDGTFTRQTSALNLSHLGQGRGILCADYDEDGRVDVLIANNGGIPSVFRNRLDAGNYLQVVLNGPAGNRHGVGAKVTVETNGVSLIQQSQLGQNYLAQEPRVLHFGLGSATSVSSVTVVWPDAAQTTVQVSNLDPNQRIEVNYPGTP